MVDAVGIEPTFMLETCHGQAIYVHSYQLLHPNLVPQEGIEPPHPDYKTGPLPLRIQGQKLVSLLGFEPRPYGPKPQMQPGNTLER